MHSDIKGSIMIIDDNPANLRLLTDLIHEYGHNARPFPNGEHALKAAERNAPDLILLDIFMPNLDGFEVCQRLKANEKLQEIPVIFISALKEPDEKLKAFQAGGVDYISKPFHKEEVLARIETHLKLSRYQRELEIKNARLESANYELRDFAHIVSHDLKAPLRGINHIVHWLVQDYADAFDAEGKEMMNLLLGRVTRMERLIKGILYYAKAGRTSWDEEEIDVNVLIAEISNMLAVPEHITIEREDRLPVLVGNKICLEQIFQNLLSNAVEFMDKDRGLISVSSVDNNTHWILKVSDNGPGIASQDQEKIFKIFNTLRAPDEQESSGVGLAIVKKLVESYGGKVWVESQIGMGSVFAFTFPKKSM